MIPLNDTVVDGSIKAPAKATRKRAAPRAAASGNGEPKSKARKTSGKSSTKPNMAAEKLLTPSSAISKVNKQDILFGTSSQLALDESPRTLRAIQQVIHESERDTDVIEILGNGDAISSKTWPRRLQMREGQKGLWTASSRDTDGQLLEKLDDVYLPEPDRTQDFPLLMDGHYDDPEIPFNPRPSSPIPIPTGAPAPAICETLSGDTRAETQPCDPDADSLTPMNEVLWVQSPPPRRTSPSELINIDDLPPSAQPVDNGDDGPREGHALWDLESDELRDSVIPVFKIRESDLAWAQLRPILFPQITEHVASIPPSVTIAQPSWREKILTYMPVVLEDLTDYLNKNTQIRVYKRATQVQIKAWNRRRAGLGKKKLEIEEGWVFAVEKDLEVGMVKQWGESQGICCIDR